MPSMLNFSKLRQVITWIAERVLLVALRFLLRTRPGLTMSVVASFILI